MGGGRELSGSVVQNTAASAGDDAGSIPESGRSPGEGKGNLLQYYCLGNPVGREGWRAVVHGVAKESDMTLRLNNNDMCNLVFYFTSDE